MGIDFSGSDYMKSKKAFRLVSKGASLLVLQFTEESINLVSVCGGDLVCFSYDYEIKGAKHESCCVSLDKQCGTSCQTTFGWIRSMMGTIMLRFACV